MNPTYQPGRMNDYRELLFTLAKPLFTGNLNVVHPFALVPGL